MRRTLLLSVWLPAGVFLQAVVRFGFGLGAESPEGLLPLLFSLPAMLLGLAFAWPGGIPLTRALQRLHPLAPRTTYACAAVLGPLTVGAATIGGLLGPLGIWIYAAVVSLPAWLALWFLQWRARTPGPAAG